MAGSQSDEDSVTYLERSSGGEYKAKEHVFSLDTFERCA